MPAATRWRGTPSRAPSPVTDLVRRVLAAVAVVFALGYGLSFLVELGPVARGDLRLTANLHQRAIDHAGVARVARDLTWLGEPAHLAVFVGLAAIWSVVHHRQWTALWLVVVTACGGMTESVLKVVVGRSRPDLDHVLLHPVTKSFPSGHATNTTIVFGAIALALVVAVPSRTAWAARFAAATAALVAVVVGLSRPVLGVHFVSDVVAGWTLGALWLHLLRPGRFERMDRELRPGREREPASV